MASATVARAVVVVAARTPASTASRAAVSVARVVVFALDYHAVVVAVITVHQECEELRMFVSKWRLCGGCLETYEGDEEGDDGDDRESPAGFEHGARLVDVGRDIAAVVADVEAEIRAVLVRDAAQHDDASNQSTHESEIDGCDEQRIVSRSEVVDQCRYCPC